jgi:hypothetical protein
VWSSQSPLSNFRPLPTTQHTQQRALSVRVPDGRMADRRLGLLCLDLDGTLLGSDHRVSRANADAVAAAAAAGWAIALSTGRGPTMFCPTARELGLDQGLFLVG